VLTIGKLGRSRGRLEYYDAQVAAGAEDYYAGRGESPGRWRGAGARALGLSERAVVDRAGFMAVMAGRDPVGGGVLREMGVRSTVSGFDLTFSAPKSVSVLFAVLDDRDAGELLAAHEHAVEVTLGYLEREACFTRRGRDGMQRLHGEGFVAASYRHRMSRAGDPHLHTHVVVANLTRAEGRYTALDARALYEHKAAGGAVYRLVLREQVRARLPWAVWHPVGRGLFELDGVPGAVLRHFSQRRVEIEERALELVGASAGQGLSRERMQGIALATRRAKTYGVDGGSWREEARARAAEHGLGHAELARLLERRPGPVADSDLGGVMVRLSGAEGLTARHNTFARRHALAELAGAFGQGAGLDQLELATDRYLGDESVVALSPGSGDEPRYTSRELLGFERDLIDGAARRADARIGVLPVALADRVLAGHEPALNEGQAAAVRAALSQGRGVHAITALAGTGKTTLVGALATAYQQAGWRVLGAAPTARAARQMRELAGIEADTMHALFTRVQRDGGLDSRTVLILDEAGMAPTRLSALLLARAELAGAKVVALGDPGQLTAVEAGGWFAALTRRQAEAALRQVLRQRDPVEQRALEALHDGDPAPYLAHKAEQITVHDTEIEALLHVCDAWQSARCRHGLRAAVMGARDNLTRERLNRAARAALRRDRTLAEHGIQLGGREYAPGDRVVARRNDRALDIDNGSLGTILSVDPTRGTLIVQMDAGTVRQLEPDYVAEHLEHAYALTGHALQGATVIWAAVVGQLEPDYVAEHLEHASALTGHALQGATVIWAAVVGRPHDFTREWAYTTLSRAREHTTLHLIAQPTDEMRQREDYAPAEPTTDSTEVLEALARALTRSEREPLAIEQTPPAPPEDQPAAPAPSSTPPPPPAAPALHGLAQLRRMSTGRSPRFAR
jgi:conjugative relaxase-like TrwC/TraI family protein